MGNSLGPMVLFQRGCAALALLTASFGAVARADAGKPFPTDPEIQFVLTQTERAIQLYKPLIDVEEHQLGKSKSAVEAVGHDREVVNALEMALKALKDKPQAFNGPLGFMFFQWLDDAGRNAVLCSSYASSQIALQMMAGNTDTTPSVINLGQSCTEVSALIYTVSENVGSLYQKYVEAEEELANRSTAAVEKCVNILKKNSGIAIPKGKQ